MEFTTNANPESVPSANMIGSESEPENGNGGANAWKKPSNGQEVPVMGAHSWPALSKGSSSSSDSLKALALDNSTSPVLPSQGPQSPQRQVSTNSNSNSSQNHTNTIPSRQRSMRHNGNSSFIGGSSPAPAQQGNINNTSSGDHTHTQRSGYSHGPAQQHPHYRNRNGHNNYVGRREQVRNFNAHLQTQKLLSRFPRHPAPHSPLPISAPFIPSQTPPQIRPFASPIDFHDFQSPMYYFAAPPGGVPFIAPMPHPMFLPAADPYLHTRIVNQIDYYFSNENLVKDMYLRQNMDDQGWVPVKLIAGFKKVSYLTNDIQLILDSLRNSTVVEVQGDKVRSRHNWMTWINRTPMQFPNVSATQAQSNSVPDMLAAGVQNVSLNPNINRWGRSDGRAEASLS